jgi:hypothetical protein
MVTHAKEQTMDRLRRAFLSAGLMLAAAVTPALAQERSADITFSGGSVAAGVGFTWGSGDLHFQGKTYPITVHGLSVVDVGVAKIEGSGDVYNLQRVEDFSGNYTAVAGGVTFAGGGALAVLENQNGVRIYVRSTTLGLKLNLSPGGVAIGLK